MRTETSAKIISYLQKRGQVSPKELTEYLGISRQALFKQIHRLLEGHQIQKIGTAPKVFYSLIPEKIKSPLVPFDQRIEKVIENSFMAITPTGERKEGLQGFDYWCQKTHQPLEKTAKEYVKTLEKYEAFKKEGLIDGMKKIRSSFSEIALDHLFYLDFYSIERFGKTKLGQMLLYAKQSQNKKLIKELIVRIEPNIKQLIKKYKIEAVGFIPPTVKREVQFMRELENNLNINLQKINLIKVTKEMAIPQKTLNKLEDRIENARQTIVVDEKKTYKNILLIDDAVGSGSTLNETARQINDKGSSGGKIIGLAITGSFKGFDVISEV